MSYWGLGHLIVDIAPSCKIQVEKLFQIPKVSPQNLVAFITDTGSAHFNIEQVRKGEYLRDIALGIKSESYRVH